MTLYSDEQRRRQTEFKMSSSESEVPGSARDEGEYRGHLYPFVLPSGYAVHNLWEPIRAQVLSHFHSKNIAWHDGQNDGPLEKRSPSPHLLDSQVCAVNFWWGLGQSCNATTITGPVADLSSVHPNA